MRLPRVCFDPCRTGLARISSAEQHCPWLVTTCVYPGFNYISSRPGANFVRRAALPVAGQDVRLSRGSTGLARISSAEQHCPWLGKTCVYPAFASTLVEQAWREFRPQSSTARGWARRAFIQGLITLVTGLARILSAEQHCPWLGTTCVYPGVLQTFRLFTVCVCWGVVWGLGRGPQAIMRTEGGGLCSLDRRCVGRPRHRRVASCTPLRCRPTDRLQIASEGGM